jgi:hypothetical protein
MMLFNEATAAFSIITALGVPNRGQQVIAASIDDVERAARRL